MIRKYKYFFSVVMVLILIVSLAGCVSSTVSNSKESNHKFIALAGSEWKPVEVDGISDLSKSDIFIQFKADNKISGMAGCNRFVGSYQLGDKQAKDMLQPISISKVGMTRMMCIDNFKMKNEKVFTEVLNSSKFYSESNNGLVLTLFDKGKSKLATFNKSDFD